MAEHTRDQSTENAEETLPTIEEVSGLIKTFGPPPDAEHTPGPWTVRHRCVDKSPYDDESCGLGIGAFLRAWNDHLPTDADRDRLLRPLVLRLVGSRSTPEVETRRSWLAMDWLVRTYAPGMAAARAGPRSTC